MMLAKILPALLLPQHSFAGFTVEPLRYGGVLTGSTYDTAGQKVIQSIMDTHTIPGNMAGVSVWESWDGSTDADLQSKVEAMTTTGDAKFVDVFFPPYTSGSVIKAIGYIKPEYTGTVMVWGGAADSIFSDTCAGKNFRCFGTFSPGSKYIISGLQMIAARESANVPLQVGLVENNDPFSMSVCKGAEDHIAANSGSFTLAKKVSLSSKTDVTTEDLVEVRTVMQLRPDVIVICGHNGFVEKVTIKVFKALHYRPRNVVGTNLITATASTNFANEGETNAMSCNMMPTQWDEDAVRKDPAVGFDKTAFEAVFASGGGATYHSASAAAAMIAVLNVLESDQNLDNLQTGLAALDIDSFYGKLKFDAKGAIEKDMAMQQASDPPGTISFVTQAGGDAKALSACMSWDKAPLKFGGVFKGTSYDDHAESIMTKLGAELNAGRAGMLGFTTQASFKEWVDPYEDAALATLVAEMTDPTHASFVDVFLPPYGSNDVIKAIDAIHANFAGAVVIYGGASDAIFETHCAGKSFKCFGTFTVGSQYLLGGLEMVKAHSDLAEDTSLATVLVGNTVDTFAMSVCNGAVDFIAGDAKFTSTSLNIESSARDLCDADCKAAVKTKFTGSGCPDVVGVCGSNGFVETVVAEIYDVCLPEAIIGTNTLTSTAATKFADFTKGGDMQKCLMMPTQWDMDADRSDPALGWNKAKFDTEATGTTYHTASAAGAMIAVLNAALENPIKEELAVLDVPSFYGNLKFDSSGRIEKSMAVLQRSGSDNVVASSANLQLLSACTSWTSHNRETTTTTTATTTTTTKKNDSSGDADYAQVVTPGFTLAAALLVTAHGM